MLRVCTISALVHSVCMSVTLSTADLKMVDIYSFSEEKLQLYDDSSHFNLPLFFV